MINTRGTAMIAILTSSWSFKLFPDIEFKPGPGRLELRQISLDIVRNP